MNYEYKAHVTSVYDGDTITVDIDLGFGVWLTKQKLRLYGIDTPEMRGDEKEEGKKARDILREHILNKDVVIHTKKDKKGKYGRWLAVVFIDDVNQNQWLVENGYAEEREY